MALRHSVQQIASFKHRNDAAAGVSAHPEITKPVAITAARLPDYADSSPCPASSLSRAFDLSGFVARNLSGCHIALGGRYEADTSATGDKEDAI